MNQRSFKKGINKIYIMPDKQLPVDVIIHIKTAFLRIHMISRRNSRVFCALYSQKTPRGMLPRFQSVFSVNCLCQAFLKMS